MFSKKIIIGVILALFFVLNLSAQDIASGTKLIKNEKYFTAKKYFSSLLNTPLKAEAYFYLGEIYFIWEKVDSAKIFYNKGIEANNEFPLNYAGLVRLNVLDGNSAEAEKNTVQATELGDENPNVFIVLSEAYSRIKNYDKAMEFLNEAVNYKIRTPDIYIAMGKVYLGKINGTEAVKSFQEALNIEPRNPEALTLKARVYDLIDNNNGAISLLDEAIANDPSYSPAYNELAEVYANMKNYSKASENYAKYIESSEITIEKQKRYAQILYIAKEYDQAITTLNEVIKVEPENPSAIRILAYSYLKLEEIENSKIYFQRLFQLTSVNYLPSDFENYADLLTKTGNDSLAIIYLYKIVELDSSRKDVYGEISVLCFKNKKWDGVISALEKKGELSAQEYFDLGKAYYFTQNYENADSAFGKLISKVPDLAIAYFWQARVKTNFDPESEQGLAKPFYEQFIQVSKEDTMRYKTELIEAYSYLGYYFYIKEDKSGARANWLKVEALDPENPQAIAALKELK
jgi:tetratricopeptide (TPR) repeat protein